MFLLRLSFLKSNPVHVIRFWQNLLEATPMRAQVSQQSNPGTNHAGMFWLTAALLLVMAIVSPLGAQAQGNYVYVNNQAAANTVSAYSVSAAGALTQLSGS